MIFAINIDVYEVDMRRVDQLLRIFFADCESHSYSFAVLILLLAVKVARNKTFATQSFGRSLTNFGALNTGNRNLLHCFVCVTLN